MARNVKPPYLIKRVDTGDLVEGPFAGRGDAEERADDLAEFLGLQLFVHSKNVYGRWKVWYRTGHKTRIIDLKPKDYEVVS